MSSSEDPFFIVRDEVQKSMNHLQELFSAWQRLDKNRRNEAQFSPEQLKWTADEIRTSIKTIEWDIQDLEETVRIVESNPQKFRLDAAEVQKRRQFVVQSKATIDEMQKTISGAHVASLQQQPKKTNDQVAPNSKKERDVDPNIHHEIQQQQVIMREQDDQLDQVFHTVVNMKNIASTMNVELEDQSRLLHQLDGKTEASSSRLKAAMARLNQIIKAGDADKKTTFCIIVLTVIVIVLLIVVIAF